MVINIFISISHLLLNAPELSLGKVASHSVNEFICALFF